MGVCPVSRQEVASQAGHESLSHVAVSGMIFDRNIERTLTSTTSFRMVDSLALSTKGGFPRAEECIPGPACALPHGPRLVVDVFWNDRLSLALDLEPVFWLDVSSIDRDSDAELTVGDLVRFSIDRCRGIDRSVA